MKKFVLIVFLIINYSLYSQGDTTQTFWSNFKTGGNGSLIFNQITFMNWVKGGENSISSTALFNYFANMDTDKFQWENTVDLKYGLQISDEYGLRTNQDEMDLQTKFGYKVLDKFYYTGLINFKSQFAPGYNYPNDSQMVSKFFSPAYLVLSLGTDYKPNDDLSIYFSPMTGKFIYIRDQNIADNGRYTSEPAKYDTNGSKIKNGRNTKSDFGAYLKVQYKAEVYKNINLDSKLIIFNNYTDRKINNRKNFDVDLEATINMKVNEFISANLLVHLIYDNDIKVPIYKNVDGVKTQIGLGPRLQLKEVIGIGITYKFD